MKYPSVASKKNIIIIVFILAIIAIMTSSAIKRSERMERKIALDGDISLTMPENTPFSAEELNFIGSYSENKIGITDALVLLPLKNGDFKSNVRFYEGADNLYSGVDYDRRVFSWLFVADDAAKVYGSAVNQQFLDATGMKIGESFKIGDITYQVRGTFRALPGEDAKELVKKPLMVVLRSPSYADSGMSEHADKVVYQYRLANNQITSKRWINIYKGKFPQSRAIVKGWDD